MAALIPWDSSSSPRPTTVTDAKLVLVDEGYFQTADVIDELLDKDYVLEDRSFGRLRRFGCKLIPLLFGTSSCSLTQLCCRRLFELLVSSSNVITCFEDVQSIDDVRTHHLESLLSTLGAPMDLLPHMKIALLRERIKWTLSQQDWNDDDDEINSDDGDRESDGEYW